MPYYFPIFPAAVIFVMSAHYLANSKHRALPAVGLVAAIVLFGYSAYLYRALPNTCDEVDEILYGSVECVSDNLQKQAIPK
jgi:ABC-type Mn2+/Zn2+ transport system permease subunit